MDVIVSFWQRCFLIVKSPAVLQSKKEELPAKFKISPIDAY